MRVMYDFYRLTVLYHGALFTNGMNANRSHFNTDFMITPLLRKMQQTFCWKMAL